MTKKWENFPRGQRVKALSALFDHISVSEFTSQLFLTSLSCSTCTRGMILYRRYSYDKCPKSYFSSIGNLKNQFSDIMLLFKILECGLY